MVLSAHLDHIGITAPVKATASTTARSTTPPASPPPWRSPAPSPRAGKPPRRSILFLTVTGEEKGLIGAEYFARNPTVPLQAHRRPTSISTCRS